MYKNKKIFILGMARSGYEVAKLLSSDNEIFITDMKEQEKDKGYYCVHTMSDVPEYKEILDQWFAAEKELAAYRDRCMKEGMKLFTRYLWDLWD